MDRCRPTYNRLRDKVVLGRVRQSRVKSLWKRRLLRWYRDGNLSTSSPTFSGSRSDLFRPRRSTRPTGYVRRPKPGLITRNIQLHLTNEGNVARDHLASERTFLAYVRTSLAIAAAGVGMVKFNYSASDRLSSVLPRSSDAISSSWKHIKVRR